MNKRELVVENAQLSIDISDANHELEKLRVERDQIIYLHTQIEREEINLIKMFRNIDDYHIIDINKKIIELDQLMTLFNTTFIKPGEKILK